METDPERDPGFLWGAYQADHITDRHDVTREQFAEAWARRFGDDPREDDEHGPGFESLGEDAAGLLLVLVWRWDRHGSGAVFPITAYAFESGS